MFYVNSCGLLQKKPLAAFAFLWLILWSILRPSLESFHILVPPEAAWRLSGCISDWRRKGCNRLKKNTVSLLTTSFCIKNIFEFFWFLIVCLDHTQHPLYVLTSPNSLQMFSPETAYVSSPTVIKAFDFTGLLCICLIIDISLYLWCSFKFIFSILYLFLVIFFSFFFFFVLAVCWLGLQVSNLTVTRSLFNSKVIFHSLFSSVLAWDTVPINSSYSIVSLSAYVFLQAGFCVFFFFFHLCLSSHMQELYLWDI